MKSLEALEKAINEAFKDDTDSKRVEALGAIKNELEHVKEEAKKQDETLEASVTKIRDLLLNGGDFKGKPKSEDEDATPKTMAECIQDVLRKEK